MLTNRCTHNTTGSLAGSLGGSVIGSRVGVTFMGPFGAIAGALGGAVAGSVAGSKASERICNAVEATFDDVCERCKSASQQGGHRLGGPTPTKTTRERLNEVASSAGETLNTAASTIGGYLSKAGDQVRKSVSSTVPFQGTPPGHAGYTLASETDQLSDAIAASLSESAQSHRSECEAEQELQAAMAASLQENGMGQMEEQMATHAGTNTTEQPGLQQSKLTTENLSQVAKTAGQTLHNAVDTVGHHLRGFFNMAGPWRRKPVGGTCTDEATELPAHEAAEVQTGHPEVQLDAEQPPAVFPSEWACTLQDIVEMGFNEEQAKGQLQHCNGDMKMAVKALVLDERRAAAQC